MVRDNCWTCRRPLCVCLCSFIKIHQSRINFVLLAHPREARSKTSTGYLAHKSLHGSRYIEDYDFAGNSELAEILAAQGSESFLLFPSDTAEPISTLRERSQGENTAVNIIAIEGTWAQSLGILARSPRLKSLPTLTLDQPRSSRFKFRSQPQANCLSTIEAIAYALQDLGEIDTPAAEDFLAPFLTMVDRQIEFQKQNNPRYRRKWELVSGL